MTRPEARRQLLILIRRTGFAQAKYAQLAIQQIDFPTDKHDASAKKAAHKYAGLAAIVWLLSTFWRKVQ